MSKNKTHYKPNVTYELLIHDIYHYVGCHYTSKPYLTKYRILNDSGNYLGVSYHRGLITHQEYNECIEILWIKEFDSREEAQNDEAEEIKKCKEIYGNLCKNKASSKNAGWKHSEETRQHLSKRHAGHVLSEETKKKISESRKNQPSGMKGKHHPEIIKRKISESLKGKQEWQKKMASLYNENNLGMTWNQFQKYMREKVN